VHASGTPIVEHPTSSRPHGGHGHLDLSRIAQDLQIRKVQVENVVQLLDEGNTIPFITRYRKERTGGLNEDVLRIIQERVQLLRQLAERKQTILRSIDNQGKLTPELRAAILAADNPRRLEDLYLPYKPKKRTLATTARDKGLEPLALAIWYGDPAVANLGEILPTMLNPEKELATPEEILEGVQHILAEIIAESADVRAGVRNVLWDTGKLSTSKSDKLAEGQGLEYKDYFQFTEPVRHIPPHRTLAINRGEKENALQVKLDWDAEIGLRVALERLPLPAPGSTPPLPEVSPPSPSALLVSNEAPPAPPTDAPSPATTEATPTATEAPPTPPVESAPPPVESTPQAEATPVPTLDTSEAPAPPAETPPPQVAPAPAAPRPAITPMSQRAEALHKHPHADFLRHVAADALTRLLVPSLEREIRRELKNRAEDHAVSVFARNLRSKLLAAPLRGRRVLAVDPGFRTGCKLAVLDEIGNLIEDGVIYPHTGSKRAEARTKLDQLVRRHQIHVIAIGNGTACRETEEIVSELIAELDARRRGEIPPPPPPAPVAETVPIPAPEAPPAPAPVEATAPPPPEAQTIVPAAESVLLAEIPAPMSEPAAALQPEAVAPPVATAAATAEPPPPPPPPPEPLPDALPELAYVIVNEAGASVYSTSPVGKEEFPNFDATLRGTVSIGRRLQDPLSELVKIDPQHVGVGLYQHDVPAKELRESLDGVVESCVNQVGVDLNTASVPLLRHVSGLNQLVARDLVEHRKKHGPFRDRQQLLQINGIGEQRFIQAAGFLKIGDAENPLDSTWIHPESYGIAVQILSDLGYGPDVLRDRERSAELLEKLKTVSPEEVARRLHAGVPTVKDILDSLARPGRDPREDLPPPVFKKGILKIEDLQPGMDLKGTVLNVVDFGAFIDIGLKDSGLVHISQMANRYVKSTYDVVSVGDVVTVWVLSVDKERHRVSLTMIAPGTERKPPEKRPEPRERRGDRGERGERGQRSERGERREAPAGGGDRGGRPPQRGRRALPPRGGRPAQAPQGGAQPAQAGAARGGAPAQRPPQQQQPPRKPRRQPPKPNLSQSALAGATPLGTFAELAAFWEAKKKEEPQPVPPPPPTDGTGEQQPPA
jgi:uncharacterized protein